MIRGAALAAAVLMAALLPGPFLGLLGAGPALADPRLTNTIREYVRYETILLKDSSCEFEVPDNQLSATFFGIPFTHPGFDDEERELLNSFVFQAALSGAYPIPMQDTGAAGMLAKVLNGRAAVSDVQTALDEFQDANFFVILTAERIGPHLASLSLELNGRKPEGGFCYAKTYRSYVSFERGVIKLLKEPPQTRADVKLSTLEGGLKLALQAVLDGYTRDPEKADTVVVRQPRPGRCQLTRDMFKQLMTGWTGQIGVVLQDRLPIPVVMEGEQPAQHEPVTVYVDLRFDPDQRHHVTLGVDYRLQNGGLLAGSVQRILVDPEAARRCADEMRAHRQKGIDADRAALRAEMKQRFDTERKRMQERLRTTEKRLEAETALNSALLAPSHEARERALKAIPTRFPGTEAAGRAEMFLERLKQGGSEDLVIVDGGGQIIRTTDHGFTVKADTALGICDEITFLVETEETCLLDIIYQHNGQYRRLSEGAMNGRKLFSGILRSEPRPRVLRPNTPGDVQLAVNCYPKIGALNQMDGDIIAAFNSHSLETGDGFAETVQTVTRESLGLYSDATVVLDFTVADVSDRVTEFGECKE